MKMSAITPCFNEGERIEKYLKVLERQTVKPEVIIVDGGSTDGTLDIIKRYMKKNRNIKLLHETGEKRSPGNARNIGWKAATGHIIYLMDVDSRIEPDFTRKAVQEFEKYPDAELIRFNCRPYFPPKFKNLIEKAIFYKDERGDQKLILFTRDIVKKVGYIDPGLGFGEDRIWMKKIMEQKITDVDTTLIQSKSGYLDFFGMAQRYIWYGRTIPMYLKKTSDRKMLAGLTLSVSLVVLTFIFWIHPYLTYLLILLLLLPVARGVAFGLRLHKVFGVKSPMFVLPFTEMLGFFFMGVGFFKYLLGDRTIGR